MRAVYSVPASGIGDGLLLRFVAANLNFYLAERNLTQREFAKEVGASEPTVSRWFAGEILPRDKHWQKIIKVLGVDSLEDLTRDPAGPRRPSTVVPDKDRDPVVRYLRLQANQLGYDLQKLSYKKGD